METGKLNFEQAIELEQKTGNQNLYSAASELALLGAILINQDKLAILDLRPDEFSNRRNGNLFRIMRELSDKGIDIDVNTICSRMDAKKPENNWTAFELYDLVAKTPSSMHAESYAAIIRDKAKRRKIMQLADKMKIIAADSESETTEQIAKVIDDLTENESDQKTISLSEALNDYHVELLDRISGKKQGGVMSGFPSFDRVTGGFHPGEMVIVSGVPGAGKSIFAMQTILNVSKTIPCVYYSIEMGKMLTTERIICNVGKINEKHLQAGKLSKDEMEHYNEALESLDSRKIHISDDGNWNLMNLKADIMKQKIRYGVQFVVIDYMYLLSDMQKEADEIARTTVISRGLKLICLDLGVSMLAIHSLNKQGMDKGNGIPGIGQLRGSGQIAFDADMILMLTDYNENVERLLLTKQELENIKMLFFVKGRTMLPGKNYISFVRSPEFPTIGEYQKEF